VKDTEGKTALIIAMQYGEVDVVNALLEHGADTEAKDRDGWTALLLAAEPTFDLDVFINLLLDGREGEVNLDAGVKLTKLLLKHGANIEAQDKDGETPLTLAEASAEIGNEDGMCKVKAMLASILANDIITGKNKFSFQGDPENLKVDIESVKAMVKERFLLSKNYDTINIASNKYLSDFNKQALVTWINKLNDNIKKTVSNYEKAYFSNPKKLRCGWYGGENKSISNYASGS